MNNQTHFILKLSTFGIHCSLEVTINVVFIPQQPRARISACQHSCELTNIRLSLINTPPLSHQILYRHTDRQSKYLSVSLDMEKMVQSADENGGHRSPGRRLITRDELKQHSSLPSIWIAVNNGVYDVTRWVKYHPGGEAAITNVGGRDATDLINQFHKPEVWRKKIESWYIGDLEGCSGSSSSSNDPSAAITTEFRQLGQWLEENGWYIPDTMYFVKKTLYALLMFSAALYLFFDSLSVDEGKPPKYTLYLSSFLIGLFWQQSNFIGHDIGHSSVFSKGSWKHRLFGNFVGNAFTGLSISWWKHSHETHHVTTNVVSHDPDIQHLPVFAISNKMFKYVSGKGAGIFSSYWDAFMPFNQISRFLVCYQHVLYFPIMTVARVNLHAQSLIFALTHAKCKGVLKMLELSNLLVFYSWWGYLVYLCPTWSSRLLFWYIANATVGIIHVQICLSHFIMETFDEVQYQKDGESYFEYQLRTTLDVDCSRYMDWFHGGLQYQVIHHLYPRLPRHRLRSLRHKVQEIVNKYRHVQYKHFSFLYANILTLKHMRDIAKEAAKGKLVPFKDTLIFEGLNAIG